MKTHEYVLVLMVGLTLGSVWSVYAKLHALDKRECAGAKP